MQKMHRVSETPRPLAGTHFLIYRPHSAWKHFLRLLQPQPLLHSVRGVCTLHCGWTVWQGYFVIEASCGSGLPTSKSNTFSFILQWVSLSHLHVNWVGRWGPGQQDRNSLLQQISVSVRLVLAEGPLLCVSPRAFSVVSLSGCEGQRMLLWCRVKLFETNCFANYCAVNMD